ncbi:MAG: HD domain-containing phosphohydrolase [Candidatus Gracilibacteria bacterium]|jgi:HD-GYP domain-containing protein (c-di-GMP phosphodiesterase class II)
MSDTTEILRETDPSMWDTEIPFDNSVAGGEILEIRSVSTHNALLVLEDDAGIFMDKMVAFFQCKDIDELRQKIASFKTYHELKNFVTQLNDQILIEIDPALSAHHVNVSRLADQISLLALKAGIINKEDYRHSHLGAYLHDIGKLAIPNHISKSDKVYTDEEHAKMHEHSLRGYLFAKMLNLPKAMCHGILSHHERCNGKGYPFKRINVPIQAQIIGLADMMWSMLENRKYRNGTSTKDFIVNELRRAKDENQFDPRLVDICIEMAETWLLNPPILVDAKSKPK